MTGWLAGCRKRRKEEEKVEEQSLFGQVSKVPYGV